MQWRLIFDGLMDLLWPPRTQCLACQGQLNADVPLLCTPCLESMPFAPHQLRCANCLRPTCSPEGLCAECQQGSPFGMVFAIGPHQDALREAIHHLKFSDRPELGALLGDLLSRTVTVQYDCVVPVPLHRSRLRERGYNQAALVADRLGRALHAPIYPDSLVRVRSTGHQAKLDRENRRHNLEGAFAAARTPAPWAGRRVLLVDDVLTTGVTAATAAAVLLASGAAGVDLAVLGVSTTPVRGILKNCP